VAVDGLAKVERLGAEGEGEREGAIIDGTFTIIFNT
jgi:hypothetical protein